MNRVVIRQANRLDLPSLEWEGEYTHFRRLYADAYNMVEQGNAIIWIIEEDGSGLIGQLFVSLLGNRPELADGVTRAYIYGFRIRPPFRNQGIGTMIMHTVEDDIRERGFRQITLNVGQDNHAARRFYERLGYKVVEPDPGRWAYIDDKGRRRDVIEPAWRMIKDLR